MSAEIVEIGQGWSVRNMEIDPPKIYIKVNEKKIPIDARCEAILSEDPPYFEFETDCFYNTDFAPFDIYIRGEFDLSSSNPEEAQPLTDGYIYLESNSCGSIGDDVAK